MKSALALIFDEILREVETNPELRARIERHLMNSPVQVQSMHSRPRNRRAEPALDPYTGIKQGEGALRSSLEALDLDQLKDVISAFSLDSSRLALKWKQRERLVELIVVTVRNRLEKGDVFRSEQSD